MIAKSSYSFPVLSADSQHGMQPRVAVIVPTYNRREKTLRFLRAIAQQTYPHLQTIIVDANSKDGTPTAIRQQFPQVQLLRVSSSSYWTASTNTGVKYALQRQFDYIFTVNDDAVFQPDHLQHLVEIAQTHGCLILGNQINYLSDPARIWSLGANSKWGSQDFLRLAYHDMQQSDLPEQIRQNPIIPVEALPGNGVLIHRSVFETIGFYNALWLPHYHADSELVMRARQRGIVAFVSPAVVLHNDFSTAQKQVNLKSIRGFLYTFFHKRSHLFLPAVAYVFFKYCPMPQKWQTLQALLARLRAMAKL